MAEELKNHISQIKFSQSSEAYIIDAKYINGELVSDVLEELRSAVASAMVFRGTLGASGTIPSLPAATDKTIGDTYKVVDDGTYANMAAELGDVFICADVDGVAKWVHVPSGNEEEGTVNELTAGRSIKFTVDGLESSTITDTGTISWIPSTHDHKYSATGTHNHGFTGTAANLTASYEPSGLVTLAELKTEPSADANALKYTPTGSVTVTHQPKGSITNTVTPGTATISVDVIDRINMTDHKITTVDSVATKSFTGTPAEIEYTSIDKVTTTTGLGVSTIDTISAGFKGTPAEISYKVIDDILEKELSVTTIDSIKKKEFTGTEGNVSVSGTVSGSTGELVKSVSTTSGNAVASIETTNASALTTATLTGSLDIDDPQTLVLSIQTSGAQFINTVTPTSGSYIASVTPVTASVSVTASGSMSGTYTPAGSIDIEFNSSAKSLTHDHQFTLADATTDYTPAGNVSVSKTESVKSLDHTHSHSTKVLKADYTPAGSIDVTLSTSEKTLGHTYTTTTKKSSTEYTPSVSVSSNFTGESETLTGTFVGNSSWFKPEFDGTPDTISIDYTPEGTVADKELTFSGTTSVGLDVTDQH